MSAVYILWLRELKRYTRSRAQMAASLGQPTLYLLALGFGLGTYIAHINGVSYKEFIATGNMLPAFVTEADGSMRELPTICVDSSEFVVSKLKDRGTHQAFGVVTNAQDFMHILRLYVERELGVREATKTKPAFAAR